MKKSTKKKKVGVFSHLQKLFTLNKLIFMDSRFSFIFLIIKIILLLFNSFFLEWFGYANQNVICGLFLSQMIMINYSRFATMNHHNIKSFIIKSNLSIAHPQTSISRLLPTSGILFRWVPSPCPSS